MKPLNLGGILLILVLGLLLAIPASAQEDQPSGLEYVVQPGDTLSKIATRFDIGTDELSTANGISNPNQLFVGDVLVLPGIEWLDGRLDVLKVPVGETFRSLRRRYHLAPEILGRVSGVVSPSQVYAGYPILVPTNSGEDLIAGRAAFSGGESLLSLSARTGANPWEVVAANQLSSPWAGMHGDVVLLPGTNQPGPGALPSPLTIKISHGNFIQGKTTVLEIGAEGETLSLSGELIGHPLQFFEADGSYVALQGVHAMTEPGPYMLTISGAVGDGDEFSFSQLVRVEGGGYGRESFSVDPRFMDAEVSAAETAFFSTFTAPATPNKLWSGVFVKPTPYEPYYNSYYGTRRSYNGSEYVYFHSGLDFGGGTGTEVICPANGKVVFIGQLEIRGNATIIDHGWGIYSAYFHQSEFFVQAGDLVQDGQVIGLVGNTGRSTGAHLHWEIWAGGVQVEPFDWMVEQFP